MTVGTGADATRAARHQITVRELLRHTSGMIYGIFDQGLLVAAYHSNLAPAKITVVGYDEGIAYAETLRPPACRKIWSTIKASYTHSCSFTARPPPTGRRWNTAARC